VAWLVNKYAATAQQQCPSIGVKVITPHVLRHSTAMRLLHAGVDTSVIALWLGHENRHGPDLPACRPHPEGPSPRSHCATQSCTRTLSTSRRAPSLSGSALIMPSLPTRSPDPARHSPSGSA
jgi:hypothetical protein